METTLNIRLSGPRSTTAMESPEPADAAADAAAADVRLVHEARSGDRGAFERLYTRYAGLVHGILLARLPAGEVEDLVQDVFLRVYRRFPSLRNAASFGPWVARIARNQAADWHRRSAPAESLPQDLSVPEADGDRLAAAVSALDVVRSLPEAYRETLVLRFVEGLTGPEIAARLGMTHGSVRVNLHRGVTLLRARMTRSGNG